MTPATPAGSVFWPEQRRLGVLLSTEYGTLLSMPLLLPRPAAMGLFGLVLLALHGVAAATNCTAKLTTGQSTTPCVFGIKYGCDLSNSSNMWAGGGCRGLFSCNGATNVPCGGGFGKKTICPCVTSPPPPPAPRPPGMPLCSSLNQSSFCTCGAGRRYPGPGDGQCWSCPSCPAPPVSPRHPKVPPPGCTQCWFPAGHQPPLPPPLPPPPPPPPPPPLPPPAPPAPPGPLCNLNGTWNMTLGANAWPVLNGGLGLSSMHITQYQGQRNYSLHWRDGHATGGHPTVCG